MLLQIKSNLANEEKNKRYEFMQCDLDLLRLSEKYGIIKNEKKKKECVNCVCTFDIETSTVGSKEEPLTWLYIWQFNCNNDFTIYGHSVSELRYFLEKLKELNESNVIIYVHNLSYEFQFLKGLLDFSQVVANAPRKPIKAESDNLEFRCSYMLSNLSLKNFCKQMNTSLTKLDGQEFDYQEIRTPITKLTNQQLEYCLIDVECLTECLKKLLTIENDTLLTIPLTSTGYVRRIVKKKMWKYKSKLNYPNEHVYQMLRDAYRGGNTHANRFFSSYIVKDCTSYDMSSAYPSAICTRKYPMGQWFELNINSYSTLCDIINEGSHALVMKVRFYNLKTENVCPYLSINKLTCDKSTLVEDNGRLLKGSQVETTLTDLDFIIVNNMYNFTSIDILECYASRYEWLPNAFTNIVKNFYEKKTKLKGVEEESTFYNLSKARLNSIYGMTVQVVDKPQIIFENGEWSTLKSESYSDLLESDKILLPYQWGVWTSAWCRFMLQEGLELVGADFIYCDTDSIKFCKNHDQDFIELNKEREHLAHGKLSACDKKGKIHNGGVFELDGIYNKFVTMGAKRYAYTDECEKLHITISGVPKEQGAKELCKIENFKDGFIFKKSGKTISKYVDNPTTNFICWNDEQIEILPYVSILNSTYDLSLGKSYKILLEKIKEIEYNYNSDREISR